MAVAAVILARDVAQHAQLIGTQVAIRYRNAQHRRVALDVEPVLETQRAELVFAQFAAEIAVGLVAELGDPLIHDPLVVFIVLVHPSLRGGSAFSAHFVHCGPLCALRDRIGWV